jgi:hypothetical protein
MTDFVNNLAETHPELLASGTKIAAAVAMIGPAMWALGSAAAVVVSPMGLVAGAVIALGAAAFLYREPIMKFFRDVQPKFAEMTPAARDLITALGDLGEVLSAGSGARNTAASTFFSWRMKQLKWEIETATKLINGFLDLLERLKNVDWGGWSDRMKGGDYEPGGAEAGGRTSPSIFQEGAPLGLPPLEPQPVEIGEGEIKVTVTVDGPGHVSGVTVPVRPENLRLNVGVDNTGMGNTGVGAR